MTIRQMLDNAERSILQGRERHARLLIDLASVLTRLALVRELRNHHRVRGLGGRQLLCLAGAGAAKPPHSDMVRLSQIIAMKDRGRQAEAIWDWVLEERNKTRGA